MIWPRPLPLLAALLLGLAVAAQAAPDAAAEDPLQALLAERGLLGAGEAAGQVTGQAPNEPSGAEAAAPPHAGADLVLTALNFLGTPYRRGGNSAEHGFDCSGFTRHVAQQVLGLTLPRRADEQARRAGLERVPRHELAPGDLVFFNTLRRSFSHVGIYVGEGRFVHAPARGSAVRVESLEGRYWARRFDGARRLVAAVSQAATEGAPGHP